MWWSGRHILTHSHTYIDIHSKRKNRFDQSDSSFARLVKLLYGVLQCTHHIGIMEENLVNSSLPKGLEKNLNELNSFIKPARSNLDIIFDPNLTNQTWTNQTINMLKKLYANCFKTLTSKIIDAMSSKNLDYANCLKTLTSKIIYAMSSKNLDFALTLIAAINWGGKIQNRI